MTGKYPDFDIQMLEIYHNGTNQASFFNMSKQFGIQNPGVPELFIGGHVLVGETEIRDHIEEQIRNEEAPGALNTPLPGTDNTGNEGYLPAAAHLTIPLVIIAAMVDSINPCAFSVLIFLLISIVGAGNRGRILLVGGIYTAAVFLFYLFSGLGIFSAIHLSGLSSLLAIIGAIVALVLGLLGVADALGKNEGFLLGIPDSRKETIEHYIRKATLPAAFVLGVLVGIFELPCTGGIYLAILGLMSREMTLFEGLPYLLLYNIVFVLPLILIVLIIAFGVSPERADTWRITHRRALRLAVGLVMIVLGLVILLGMV